MGFHNTKLLDIEKLGTKRILRIFIFVIILLVLVGFASAEYLKSEEYACPTFPKPGDLEYYTIHSVISSINNLKLQKSDDLKVTFIGASTIRGLEGCTGTSIPEYYQKFAGDGIHVYDFSLFGAYLHDFYLIFNHTLNYSDIVIFNIPYMHFAQSFYKDMITYPELKNLSRNAEILKLQDNIEKLQSLIFGNHPQTLIKWLKNRIRCFYNTSDFCEYRINTFDSLSEIKKKEFIHGHRDACNSITNTNFNNSYFSEIANLAKSSNKTVIAIATPFNSELYKKYNICNETKLKNHSNFIRSFFNNSLIFIDYHSRINMSEDSYHDLYHFTEKGKRAFAEILFNDTKKYFKR